MNLTAWNALLTTKNNTVMKTEKTTKRLFSAISINRITAERFRSFSKKVAGSHSDTLDQMMDFFEVVNISPRNRLMMHRLKLYNFILRRIDYIVELLREQESLYHKPTHDMLRSLFDGTAMGKMQQPAIEEPRYKERKQEELENIEPKISLEKYNVLHHDLQRERREFLKVLNSISEIKPHFGKPYLKVEMDATKLSILKRRLKD